MTCSKKWVHLPAPNIIVDLMHCTVVPEGRERLPRRSRQRPQGVSPPPSLSHPLTDAAHSWDIVGMQVVENLTQFAISAGNAAVGMATIRAQAMQAGLGAVQDFAKPKGSGGGADAPPAPGGAEQPPEPSSKTLPSADALTDPGLTEAVKVQGYVDALNQLVRGGEDYAPDWDMITGDSSVRGVSASLRSRLTPLQKGSNTSGAAYVENALGNSLRALNEGKPVSKLLVPVVTRALEVVRAIRQVARSAESSNDDALRRYWKEMDALVKDVNGIVMQANFILQQPATKGAGPALPQTPAANTTSSAVSDHLYLLQSMLTLLLDTGCRVRQTTSRFDPREPRSVAGLVRPRGDAPHRESATTEPDDLRDDEPEPDERGPQGDAAHPEEGGRGVHQYAVSHRGWHVLIGRTALRAQFSQILQFFISVASLLNNVLGPNIKRWADTMESTAEIAGVTIGGTHPVSVCCREQTLKNVG